MRKPRIQDLTPLVVGVAVVAVQAIHQAPAPRAAERHVPFAVGEALSYNVSWSSITAGTATLTVRDRKPSYGSVAYYVTAEGSPTPFLAAIYPVYYKADTLMDVYTLLPQRASLFSREGRTEQMKETIFDQMLHRALFQAGTAKKTRQTMKIPPDTQDALSALYSLRAMTLKPGLRMTMPVCYGGSLLTVQVTVGSREVVGTRTAWRVTPVITAGNNESGARKMTVWMTDDSRRLPIRMSVEVAVGSFDLTLRGATPGGR